MQELRAEWPSGWPLQSEGSREVRYSEANVCRSSRLVVEEATSSELAGSAMPRIVAGVLVALVALEAAIVALMSMR